ncbi:MAG: polymerase sigma-B factor [Thermoleophilaceae bacterium]|nr:polymerase sigma-B factor [Thermoleophilaceae bacterium]MEA2455101.1 polymerase sigma-B factor [Thermoleophilaceae bacterium]
MAVAVAAAEPAAPDGRLHEDERLLQRYHGEGDLEAREQLVLRFLPLARQLASRYRHSGESLEDLVQVACIGLLKAVDRYDTERGNGFARYAVPTMLGELKRHFRDKGWALRVPRATQELALKVSEQLGTLPAKLGRSPRPRDVAEALGVPVEDVLEAMEAATAYETASLDAPRAGGEDEAWTHADALGAEEHGYELVELGETLRGTLDALPARERLILRLRFERDMTQAEIATCVGVSQMHVSRLLRRSLDRLSAVRAAAA